MSDITQNNIEQGTMPMQAIPKTYFMIALRGMVVMPGTTAQVDVARDKSMVALTKAIDNNESLFLVPQKHSQSTNPAPKDLCRVGVICRVKQLIRLPGNDVTRLSVEAVERAEIKSFLSLNPCFQVEVETLEDKPSNPFAVEALKRTVADYYKEFLKLDAKVPTSITEQIDVNENPDKFCYMLAPTLLSKEGKLQDFLACTMLEKRLEIVCVALCSELEILRVEKVIAGKVRRAMEKNQKEYFLREQAKAIHEELGDGEDDLDNYLKKAEQLALPSEPMSKIKKEVQRLGKMSNTSPEAGVARSYIEWILDLPWSKCTEDSADLLKAREILDADHYGLEKVKQRILEYLAVMHLTKSIKGPILCFVGPPGVGKTSIVKSIAKALGRKFVSMSLGGVNDEAEIRGHRRTYIGAIPGRIIYHMKQSETVNPVFLLDEIDKMGSDYKGDPSAAMLEVLDPEQNFQFRDHYLEIAYDLSKVLFVTTANTVESIPAPLLDRMELIELSGYTEDEKVEIARRYLLPKQQLANGLSEVEISLGDDAMRYIISAYTRESGVRSLERRIGSVCRKIACKIVESKDTAKTFAVDKNHMEEYLGSSKYIDDILKDEDEIGAATGLAWTSVGGTTMTVEVALIKDGKGEIILTGQLGDVMKESARTAISLVRSMADIYGIDPHVFSSTDIHLHVPEGATPKDGPSAGITIATAVLSALCGLPVDRHVAMTGEITLRGRVLPIGGLKEKMLAAQRLGITKILIPKENEKDLSEIPSTVKDALTICTVDNIRQVFDAALVGMPTPPVGGGIGQKSGAACCN